MLFINKLFGDANARYLKSLRPMVDEINSLEKKFESFSNDDFKKQTNILKQQLADGKTLDGILPETFALTREAAKQTLKMRHYDVQLLGGIVLHQGQIAEMKTGEGKTLAAVPAIFLNALTGRGVHVVTVNDYLAKRDANWMGAIFDALGVTVGCIAHDRSYLFEKRVASDENETTIEYENLKEDIKGITNIIPIKTIWLSIS